MCPECWKHFHCTSVFLVAPLRCAMDLWNDEMRCWCSVWSPATTLNTVALQHTLEHSRVLTQDRMEQAVGWHLPQRPEDPQVLGVSMLYHRLDRCVCEK